MSKQPFRLPDNSFRKVQAEKFDNEDDDENDEEALNQILEGKQHVSILNDHEINILINQGKCVEALKKLVEQVPSSGEKNAATRVKALGLAVRALSGVKQTAAIDAAIKVVCGSSPASSDELVVLLKYVFKTMDVEKTADSLAAILLWHERILQCGGAGLIARVFFDRQRL